MQQLSSASCIPVIVEASMLRLVLAGYILCQAWPNRLQAHAGAPTALNPARVFDGAACEAREGWIVIVKGERIAEAGPADEVKVPDGARVIELPGATVLPGLIDAHSHLLLHPYNETSWNDQVLKEPLALR